MNAWVCIADLAGRREPIPGGLRNAIHGVTYRPAPQYIPWIAFTNSPALRYPANATFQLRFRLWYMLAG